MIRKIICLVFAVLVTLFIFNNSMQPASVSSERSSRFVEAAVEILEKLDIKADDSELNITKIVRKSAHIAEFTAQALFLGLLFLIERPEKRKNIPLVLFLGLFTACVDEALQLSSAGRSAEVTDVFVDFSGTVLATLVLAVCGYILELRRRKKKCVR